MKIVLYTLILLFAASLAGCENTDYLKYDREQKDRLYFALEEVRFEYGFKLDSDIDLAIPVEVIGFVNTGEESRFVVEVNQELTTAVEGVHFHLPVDPIIPKDSARGTLDLDFIKSNLEMDKLYTLTLDLVENGIYRPTDKKRCTVYFGNLAIPAPAWWISGKLGEYTQEKYVLFVELFHQTEQASPLMWEKIQATWGPDLEGSTTNLLLIYDYQNYLKKYILEPMYNYYLETGDEMFAMPNPN